MADIPATRTHGDPALAALRILVAQAPADQLHRPEYQDALTIIARDDGIRLVDDAEVDPDVLDPLLQTLLIVAMKVNLRQLACVRVDVSGGPGYRVPCNTVGVHAITADWIAAPEQSSCAEFHWFHAFSMRLDRHADRQRMQETIDTLSGCLALGTPVTTASLQEKAEAVPA